MKIAMLILATMLPGCTANDVTPDKFNLATSIDADDYNLHSISVGLTWNIRQPSGRVQIGGD